MDGSGPDQDDHDDDPHKLHLNEASPSKDSNSNDRRTTHAHDKADEGNTVEQKEDLPFPIVPSTGYRGNANQVAQPSTDAAPIHHALRDLAIEVAPPAAKVTARSTSRLPRK